MENEKHAKIGVTIPMCLRFIIIAECRELFKVSICELQAGSRQESVTWCRHLIRYFMRVIPKEKPSLLYVAKHTGCKKHESILHSVKCIKNRTETEKDFELKIKEVESKILNRWKKWEE